MPTLITPYDLPFEAFCAVGPLLSTGGDVLVDVDLQGVADRAAVDDIDAAVILFSELASTGALAGANIPPWNSTLGDHTFGAITSPRRMSWRLERALVDESALLVLLHALLDAHAAHPIARVTAASPSSPRVQRIAYDPDLDEVYPRAYGQVPFPWSIDEDSMDSPTLTVRFHAAPDAARREAIVTPLLTWAAATARGAYAVADELPSDCGMVVSPDELIFMDDELEWPFGDFRADPDAFLGVVNALAAISQRIAPVAEVAIV